MRWALSLVIFNIVPAVEQTGDQFYEIYLSSLGRENSIVSHEATYLGTVGPKKEYYLVLLSYAWEVLPGNTRGNAKILVFDSTKRYVGRYMIFDPSTKASLHEDRLDLTFPKETPKNQATFFGFSNGLPQEDSGDYGFSYVTGDPVTKPECMTCLFQETHTFQWPTTMLTRTTTIRPCPPVP